MPRRIRADFDKSVFDKTVWVALTWMRFSSHRSALAGRKTRPTSQRRLNRETDRIDPWIMPDGCSDDVHQQRHGTTVSFR